MMAFETKATTTEVKITNPNERRLIGLFIAQKSFQDVFQAAAYNKGGRKIRKTRSGPILIFGIPGIKLINKPPITNKIG